jgi:hypothetical protein
MTKSNTGVSFKDDFIAGFNAQQQSNLPGNGYPAFLGYPWHKLSLTECNTHCITQNISTVNSHTR